MSVISAPPLSLAPAQPNLLPLEDYQQDEVQAILEQSHNRGQMHVVQLPIGGGKTRVGIALAGHFLAQDYRVLWVAKKWGLLEQAAAEFDAVFPEHRSLQRRIGGWSRRLISCNLLMEAVRRSELAPISQDKSA